MRKKIEILTCCVILICFTPTCAQEQIQRMEPANWWIGMKHNSIQLLVYGNKAADLDPSIDYPGLTLHRIIKVQNPNYLFLDVTIDNNARPGTADIKFSKEGRQVQSFPFRLLEREKNGASIKGFDNSDAIYLITPDRFVNGDPSNDNVASLKEKINREFKGGRHGGDIQGIRNSLDYVKNMGFTAIWLNPVLENDMEEYSYHGYSITDFYKVDPRYGSNEEYLRLAEELRERDMKLIMDMIVNHCGLNHWWMKDLPSDDWINQWEEYTETNHQKTVIQDPYVSTSDKKIFTDGWFVPTMPDINHRNELVANYLIQNSIWWIEYLGLGGIRMDTYPYPDMNFMTDWTRAVMTEYPNFNIVGEEWFHLPSIVAYWQEGKRNPNGYESFLKSLMDFPLQGSMSRALRNGSWMSIYETLSQDFLYADPYALVVFPDNHDMDRIFTQVNENLDAYKQALAFVLTIRGTPQIYYGTEVLMKNPGTHDHGVIRSDFPGGWEGDKVNAFTGKGLTDQQKEAREYLTKLLHWRKDREVIHSGELLHFIPRNGIYVYFRYNNRDKVMVILNKNAKASGLGQERFSEMLEGERQGKDVITSRVYPLDNSIRIPARGVLILELE